MIFWDEHKRAANLAKHGFDFADIDFDFIVEATIVPAKLNRFKAINHFRNGIITVIFFKLGTEGLSIISMRPADKKERKLAP
jgi:uncharacterized DUF497 family protein